MRLKFISVFIKLCKTIFRLQPIDRLDFVIVFLGKAYCSNRPRYHELLWRCRCGFFSMEFCLLFAFNRSINWFEFFPLFSKKKYKVSSIVSANTKFPPNSVVWFVQFRLEFIIHCELFNTWKNTNETAPFDPKSETNLF